MCLTRHLDHCFSQTEHVQTITPPCVDSPSIDHSLLSIFFHLNGVDLQGRSQSGNEGGTGDMKRVLGMQPDIS